VSTARPEAPIVVICPLEHERNVLTQALGARSARFRWVVSGPGGANVRRALNEIDRASVELVILAGCAGGLMAGAGPIGIASEVVDGSTPSTAGASIAQRFPRPPSIIDSWVPQSDELTALIDRRAIVGVDQVVASVEQKRALCVRTGCVMVDTESHAFAARATELRLPWCVLRGVSDGHCHTLPRGCETWIDEHGSTRLARVLASLARRPWMIADVIKLGSRTKRALQGVARVLAKVDQVQTIEPAR